LDIIELLFFATVTLSATPMTPWPSSTSGAPIIGPAFRQPQSGHEVAELLDILKITKQSLGRVRSSSSIKDMCCRRRPNDRRQRLLFVTPRVKRSP